MQRSLFLLQMAGTSGVGKSTLARLIGQHTGAAVVDYDVVKSAALDAGVAWDQAGRVGYGASRAIADSLLHQGMSVILDSPCRFQQIVDEGSNLARMRGAVYGFIECVLTDEPVLRQRMQTRRRHRSQRRAFDVPPPDAPNDVMANAAGGIRIPESKVPTTPWIRIDTAQSVEQCLALAIQYLDDRCRPYSQQM
ncbi:MAG: ATP-binding protein [Chloroflexota bacterium]|nr:ATP-binding protein [Chloroflexota bacterium]